MRRVRGLSVGFVLVTAGVAAGQSASRALPDEYRPGGPAQTITITLADVGGVTAAGVEDQPPSGWNVSNISNSGTFDGASGKVKWGPFFSPSIPTTLTYDIAAPASAGGEACFAGTASFGGLDEPIAGDLCIPAPIPAASTVGLIVLAGLIVGIGGFVLAKRRHAAGASTSSM